MSAAAPAPLCTASEASAPSVASKAQLPPEVAFPVGSKVDALDVAGTWYVAKVVDERGHGDARELLVHYNGWKARYDEWVGVGSGRVRAAGSGELGPCKRLAAAAAARAATAVEASAAAPAAAPPVASVAPPPPPGGLRMEVACCDADHEGVWEGEWEECEVVADHGDTCDVRIVEDGELCFGVPRRMVRAVLEGGPRSLATGSADRPVRRRSRLGATAAAVMDALAPMAAAVMGGVC